MILSPKPIYLDYNASAPLCQASQLAMMKLLTVSGNPSSVHMHGRLIRKQAEWARKVILDGLHAPLHELYFTGGATEANGQLLTGFQRQNGRIITAGTEHDSVLSNSKGAVILPVSDQGIVDLDCLEGQLKESAPGLTLVSLMTANNETGVIQPFKEISALCTRYNALFHMDASQAVGRVKLDLLDSHVDYMTLSAHKLGGPVGVGALLCRKGAPLSALYGGGGQEQGMRPGTLNWLGIIAFGHAFQEALNFSWQPVEALRNEFEAGIQAISPKTTIAAFKAPRIPNTSCLSMDGVFAETQVIAFDLEGFSVSAGSACSSGKVKTSHVLTAMGYPEEIAKTFIRVSLCPQTTRKDIHAFMEAWKILFERHTKEMPA